MPSGGSVAFLYGFIFCVFCNFALAASLGELVAIWPTAGGQYHFCYALCNEQWKMVMVRRRCDSILSTVTDLTCGNTELLYRLDQHRWLAHTGHNRVLFFRYIATLGVVNRAAANLGL